MFLHGQWRSEKEHFKPVVALVRRDAEPNRPARRARLITHDERSQLGRASGGSSSALEKPE